MLNSENPQAKSASLLRVALFTDTYLPQINGVTRTLERLCTAIREQGGVVRVFTTTAPDAPPDDDVTRFPSVPFWAYKELRLAWPSMNRLRQQLRAFRPNLIHVATPVGMGLAGRRLALEMGVPLVSSYHTSLSAYAEHYKLGVITGPSWRFLKWFHNSGLRTYCPSQAIIDDLKERGFTNTALWSRGVDASQFSPTLRSPALRTVMGANDRSLVVTYVGRLAAEKGLDVATDALRLAAEQRPGRIVFSCIGDGPYSETVRKNAPRSSWLPGKMTGKPLTEAYASGDVFLFPSTTDTFGNVILEAMASGLPVLGADVGPTRELVGGDRGWLAEAGNAQEFAKVLVSLVDNPDLLAERRKSALEFARGRSWSRIWEDLFRDYSQAMTRANRDADVAPSLPSHGAIAKFT